MAQYTQTLKSLLTQQAGSRRERRASPQRELTPSAVSPRTSATPGRTIETLISPMPSLKSPRDGLIEKLPLRSASKMQGPRQVALPSAEITQRAPRGRATAGAAARAIRAWRR